LFNAEIADEYLKRQAQVEVVRDPCQHPVEVIVLQSKRGGGGSATAIVKTTAEWEALPNYVPKRGEIDVYSDFMTKTDCHGNPILIPGLKVGDGQSVIGSLPFAGASMVAELLTLSEREMLNILNHVYPDPCDRVMTDEELEEILDSEGPVPAEHGSDDILTDDELLDILNQEDD
jgi:hypothetical protein